jgi:hypothetical protein
MALGDPISLTYDGAAQAVNRINQDNYGAVYYGEGTDKKFTLSVKHTIPSRGESGESHLVRLDVEHYAAGVYIRTASAWMVIRTDDGVQDQEMSEDAAECVVALCSAANLTKIIGRQS